jgi:hypothetical protein
MSSPTQDRLRDAKLKVERAKKHVIDLEGVIRAFLNTNPYVVASKRDPNTRQLICYLANVQPCPSVIPIIAGDAIQCLRSALDHLAYALWRAGVYCSATREDNNVAFPVTDAAKYTPAKFQGKIQGSRQEVIDALKAIEPHEGGKGHPLWMLHRLNNIDKHRLLITVGSAFRSMNVLAMAPPEFLKFITDNQIPLGPVFLKPADRMCPLKAGDVLYTGRPDEEPGKHHQFAFDVAFSEAKVAEGDPVVETVHQFTQLVDDILNEFGRLP